MVVIEIVDSRDNGNLHEQDKKTSRNRPAVSVDHRTCFTCDKTGYFARECPDQKGGGESKSAIVDQEITREHLTVVDTESGKPIFLQQKDK